MTQFEEKAASRRFFFRKENRILRRSDFLKVYQNGQAWRRPLVHVFILPPVEFSAGEEPQPTRLGITVTRKAGKAVHRNRGRRLVRESFRHILPELKPGYSIVVNVMRAGTQSSMQIIDTQLRSIFRQAGLFSDPEDKIS